MSNSTHGTPSSVAADLAADAAAVLGENAGTSDARDGRTAGLTNRGGAEGGPVVSDEAGPAGGINEVATSDAGATDENQPASEGL